MRRAFTLAEVLITLAIIGVVAAMTLPTLIQKNEEKVTSNKLKKVYSGLSQAWLMVYKDYGEPTNWGISPAVRDEAGNVLNSEDTAVLGNLFAKHLNVVKNCGTGSGCWASDTTYFLNGQPYSSLFQPNVRKDMTKLRLEDGTSLGFGNVNSGCTGRRGMTKALSSICGWVVVDINGDKRPNTYGVDIFEFNISKYGVIPYGLPEDTAFPFENTCTKTGSGNGCTAWVIYNGNMDYLHCDGLSWNGNRKCK